MDSNTSSGSNEEGQFGDAEVVIFNLDTTEESSKKNEICQIAAWCKGQIFNVYILPNGRPLFKNINGFKKIDNKLLHYEKEVAAVSPKDGLKFFLDFLSSLTGNSRKILLAAHNCFSFHRHIIIRLMKQYGMLDTFKSLVLGFIDTIDVFKTKLPEREKNAFGLEKLEQDYLNTIQQPKDAVVNVKILVDLLEKIGCTDAIMKQHAKDLDEFTRYIDLQTDFDSAVADDTLKKIAKAGITTDMLKVAYKANSDEGVAILFGKGVDGKDPVKMMKTTIKKISERVAQLCAENEENGTV